MVCYLTGWKNAEAAASGAMAGSLLENHVVSEVARSYSHRGVEPPLYFWRDKERREIDLIIAEDGELFPIEVELTATPTVRDVRGISALQKKGAQLGKGMVACMVDEPFPLTADVEAMSPDIVW
jgi:hypothetical protein